MYIKPIKGLVQCTMYEYDYMYHRYGTSRVVPIIRTCSKTLAPRDHAKLYNSVSVSRHTAVVTLLCSWSTQTRVSVANVAPRCPNCLALRLVRLIPLHPWPHPPLAFGEPPSSL